MKRHVCHSHFIQEYMKESSVICVIYEKYQCYSYGIHTHMESSDFGNKIQYAYGDEHMHLGFILISAAAYMCNLYPELRDCMTTVRARHSQSFRLASCCLLYGTRTTSRPYNGTAIHVHDAGNIPHRQGEIHAQHGPCPTRDDVNHVFKTLVHIYTEHVCLCTEHVRCIFVYSLIFTLTSTKKRIIRTSTIYILPFFCNM